MLLLALPPHFTLFWGRWRTVQARRGTGAPLPHPPPPPQQGSQARRVSRWILHYLTATPSRRLPPLGLALYEMMRTPVSHQPGEPFRGTNFSLYTSDAWTRPSNAIAICHLARSHEVTISCHLIASSSDAIASTGGRLHWWTQTASASEPLCRRLIPDGCTQQHLLRPQRSHHLLHQQILIPQQSTPRRRLSWLEKP